MKFFIKLNTKEWYATVCSKRFAKFIQSYITIISFQIQKLKQNLNARNATFGYNQF